MMQVLQSKAVLTALVALVVAVAAVFGLDLNGEALTAAIAVLATAAGALGGALMRSQAQPPAPRSFSFLDALAEAGGQAQVQAMEQPFIYPDVFDDDEDLPSIDLTEVLVELTEEVPVLRERIEKLEAALGRLTGDL